MWNTVASYKVFCFNHSWFCQNSSTKPKQLALVVNAFLYMRQEVLIPKCCHKHCCDFDEKFPSLMREVVRFFCVKPYFQGFCEKPIKPEEAQQWNNNSCSQEVFCVRNYYWNWRSRKTTVFTYCHVCALLPVSVKELVVPTGLQKVNKLARFLCPMTLFAVRI